MSPSVGLFSFILLTLAATIASTTNYAATDQQLNLTHHRVAVV